MKKKQLTMLLASALVISNVAITKANASTVAESNIISTVSNSDSTNNSPTVKIQKVYFDKNKAEDVKINDINFNGTTLKELQINGSKIDKSAITTGSNSLTISKDALSSLDFKTGIYSLSIKFSDNTLYVGYVNIDYKNGEVVTPPPSKPEETPKPPAGNENDTVTADPVIGETIVSYDFNNPSDITIGNVNFNKNTLNKIYLNNSVLSGADFRVTDDSIIIPQATLSKINLVNGNYSMSFAFSNGKTLLSAVELSVKNYVVVKPPVVNPIIPPTNNPTEPPADDKDNKDDLVNAQPTIGYQQIKYNLNNTNSITIHTVKFDGTKLSSIYINNNLINANEVTVSNDSITIPEQVLSRLNLVKGNYSISFVFNNNKTLVDAVDLVVENNVVISAPSQGNTTPNIVFDVNKNTNVEITNIIPTNAGVNSIHINGKEVAIKSPIMRLANANFEPYVYLDNGNLIIPKETLLYLKVEDSHYDIDITLDDGQVLKESFNVSVIDSSNTTTPSQPGDKNDSTTTPSQPEDKDNGTTAPSQPEDNNNSTTTSSQPEDKNNNTSNANVSTPSNDAVNKTNNKENSSSKSAKTGDVASAGLIVSLLSAVTGLKLTRKKD